MERRLQPYFNAPLEDVADIHKEIVSVAELLNGAAQCTLPIRGCGKSKRYTDNTLKQLCRESAQARRAWRDAGRPENGPLYEEKLRLRRAVRRRIRACAAKAERKREKLFTTQDSCITQETSMH